MNAYRNAFLTVRRRLLHQGPSRMIKSSATADVSASGLGASSQSDHLIWLDLELSGLEWESDVIMEIGCLVTDKNLNHSDKGINVIVHQADSVLDAMNDWCKIQHGQSGLTEECRASKVSVAEAEADVLAYMAAHTPPGVCQMAGNSVHEDRRFLLKHMPRLTDHAHYRIVDVSTVKELCRRWYPKAYSEAPVKTLSHRSIADIKDSIEELRYYWSSVFK